MHAPLQMHVAKRNLRARRSIEKRTRGSNVMTPRSALPTSSFLVRKRRAFTESKQASTTRTRLQVMDNDPCWDNDVNVVLGM